MGETASRTLHSAGGGAARIAFCNDWPHSRTVPVLARRLRDRQGPMDLVFVLTSVLFFLLTWLYARGCERL